VGRPKKKPAVEDTRHKNVVAIRGTDEWKKWLDELAALNGAPVTVTIEQALRDLAEKLKHRKAPPRY
jgi:predicted transcriptional regulator